MSSIDERVVEAKFDNKQFQTGVKETLSSLDSLKKGMQLEGAAKGIDKLGSSSTRVADKFNAMRIAATTAVATLAYQAVRAGERIISAFTFDPIKAGFENYETQINAVQTILANTGLKGAKGMNQINGVLADLNTYANKTIYNFSEMARNIGTFTAAGVKLKPAATAIKGIANLAAMSGSTSQQASTAMYQLSQALAAGRVKLQDWNSVVNAGLGGKVFQKALYDTANAMHTIKNAKVGETFEEWTKKGNTFRGSLQDGWVTSKVLTNTLMQFTGDLSDAQLKSQGFTKAQIKSIQEQASVANDAATKIKTFSQMTQALREEVASAYAAIFKTLFGNITTARALFTPLHNLLQNTLTNPINDLNKVLEMWAKLGGRTAAIDAFKAAWKDLHAILNPVLDAFHQIFHTTYGLDVSLTKITFAVRDFFEHFKMGAKTTDELRRIFAGLFAIVDIAWQAIKALVGFIVGMLKPMGHTTIGLVAFVAKIGDMLVALDAAIKKGDGFKKFFDKLHAVLVPVMTLLGMTRIKVLDLGIGLAAFFKGITQTAPMILDKISAAIHSFMNKLVGTFHFDKLLQIFNAGLFAGLLLLINKFINHLKRKSKEPSPIQKFIDKITQPFKELTGVLKQMQQTLQVASIVAIAVAVGILTASVVALSMLDTKRLAVALGAITVMFAQIVGMLYLFNKGKIGGAKGMMSASASLILIATALRIMASAIKELSTLSWSQIAKGLTGITGELVLLIAATKFMDTSSGGMIRTGAGLVVLAAAIKLLASAVGDFGKMSWSQIAKGLAGVGATLLTLGLFTRFAKMDKAGISSGAGLLLLAAGIKVLASAAADFAKISWQGLAKGFAALTGILLAVTIFSKTVGNPIKLMAASAALIGIGVAMNILARALGEMGNMSWSEIAKSLVELAGSLLIINVAMIGMEEALPGAAAMVLISGSLMVLAGALNVMGGMSWGEIGKSLVELAGSLTIIALAMAGMVEALPGAAALLVVSAALVPLTAVLTVMGNMSWGDIAKALLALAGAFTVIGLAAALLTPVIPSIFGLAGGIALLGIGLAAIGGGVYLFATGLQILAIAGSGAAASIKLIVESFVGLLPTIAIALGKTLVAVAKSIAAAAPALLATSIVLIDGLLLAISREGPKIINTFFNLLDDLLRVIEKRSPSIVQHMANIVVLILNHLTNSAPQFVTAATNLMVAFLIGVRNNVGRLVSAGTNIIVALIKGVSNAGVRITNAAIDAVLSFLIAFDTAVVNKMPLLQDAGFKLIADIMAGVIKGAAKAPWSIGWQIGKDLLAGASKAVGRKSPAKEFIKLGQDINHGLAIGLVGGRDAVTAAWNTTRDLLRKAIDNASGDITSYQSKLKSAQKSHDTAAIKQYTAALAEAHHEYNVSTGALDLMNHHMKTQHDRLIALSKRYDQYTAKLDAANQKLKDAKQIRDDYNKSVVDQYNQLPDIAPDTQLADYETALKKQVVDTQSFTDVVAKLRKLGLNDAAYKELIAKGPDALPFAEQILAGGKASVKELNDLNSQLAKEAKALGAQASSALYQAGVNSAQGLVDGLVKQRDKIAAAMRNIANVLVTEIKRELKIKSPSQVFDEVGLFTGMGLAGGLEKSIPHVQKATRNLGKNTIASMKQSIRDMKDALEQQSEFNPTITPVLDLSTVQKQAGLMGRIMTARKLSMDAAYSKAANASAGYEANLQISPDGNSATPSADISFVQNNYSPKPLSTAEIYRSTNNQLSRVKGALSPSAT